MNTTETLKNIFYYLTDLRKVKGGAENMTESIASNVFLSVIFPQRRYDKSTKNLKNNSVN